MKITFVDTTEEFWPGQKENMRTARLEVWTDEKDLHYPYEPGRITTSNNEIFNGLRDWLWEKSDCPFCHYVHTIKLFRWNWRHYLRTWWRKLWQKF